MFADLKPVELAAALARAARWPTASVRLVIVSLALILLVPAVAHATTEGFDCQGEAPAQQAPAKPEPPPNIPPPPLFPRHRRGLYLNRLGLEVLDATPQSPPLDTDDPGVPEKGEYEINLTTHADLSPHTKTFDLLFVDANYGLLPTVLGRELPTQLKFEVPVSAAVDSDHPFAAGLGAAKVGLKFNFYNSEHHSLAMSFYPQIEFVLGSRSVEEGFAEPGQTLIFPLLVSKELKYVTLVVNGPYTSLCTILIATPLAPSASVWVWPLPESSRPWPNSTASRGVISRTIVYWP